MKSIEVYSAYALDRYIRNDKVFRESPGGPALFINETLTDLNIPHKVYSPDPVIVEILFTDLGEFGKVPHPPEKQNISGKNGSLIIISTLLDEWRIVDGIGSLYVDIQGYVRDGSDFGKKRDWSVPKNLWPQIECIKGTEEEIRFLDQEFIIDQKANRQLIITQGAAGVDLFVKAEQLHIDAETLSNLPDTVGAGDTWFAAYVAHQALGKDFREAAAFATKYVAHFLRRKVR